MTTEDQNTMFERACRLQSVGRDQEALDLFRELERQGAFPDKTPGMIGMVLYHAFDRATEARAFLERAVEVAPEWEMASLSLFHVLLELDETEKAFDEMERFLARADSPKYMRLLAQINREE